MNYYQHRDVRLSKTTYRQVKTQASIKYLLGKGLKKIALIVSTGCIRAQERAHERPPAKADFRTLPAGISIGGGTATTVAASNQILLYIGKDCNLFINHMLSNIEKVFFFFFGYHFNPVRIEGKIKQV